MNGPSRKLYLTLRMRVVAKAKAKMSAPGLVKPVVVDQLVLLVSSLLVDYIKAGQFPSIIDL